MGEVSWTSRRLFCWSFDVNLPASQVDLPLWQNTAGADPGIFLGGGALVSCFTSTPINHIFFFCRIPVVLENRRSSQGGWGGGGAHPLHPPPRSAPALAVVSWCCRQMRSAKQKNDILQKTATTLNKTHPTKQKWTNNSFHNTQETSTLLKMISSFLSQQVMLAKLLTFNSHEYQPADYTGTSELAHCIRLTIQRSQVWALQWPPTQYLFW